MLEEGVDGQGDHGMAEDILSNCNAGAGNNAANSIASNPPNNTNEAEVITIVNEEDEEE